MRYQSGFTAVEVLVTLIIAFLLVGGSYQAYNVVVSNSSEANDRSIASNLAYNTLRAQAAKVSATCNPQTIYHSIPGTTTLPGTVSMTTRHTCPYSPGNQTLTLVTTTLTYDSGGKEVKHAIITTQ